MGFIMLTFLYFITKFEQQFYFEGIMLSNWRKIEKNFLVLVLIFECILQEA